MKRKQMKMRHVPENRSNFPSSPKVHFKLVLCYCASLGLIVTTIAVLKQGMKFLTILTHTMNL